MGTLIGQLSVALAAHRRRLNLSQEVLAERAGLHRTYVGAVERGEANVTLETLEKLAGALEVDACALICRGATHGGG